MSLSRSACCGACIRALGDRLHPSKRHCGVGFPLKDLINDPHHPAFGRWIGRWALSIIVKRVADSARIAGEVVSNAERVPCGYSGVAHALNQTRAEPVFGLCFNVRSYI